MNVVHRCSEKRSRDFLWGSRGERRVEDVSRVSLERRQIMFFHEVFFGYERTGGTRTYSNSQPT